MPDLTNASDQRRVLILSVGGIMTAVPQDNGVLLSGAFDEARVRKAIPDVEKIADIEVIQLMQADSANSQPADWLKIIRAVHENTDRYDGIVVLHGMDTMAYTAAALSFALRRLPVPVVFTGATTPLEYISSDAKRNLSDAIHAAAHADLAEVCVVNDGRILRGNRIKKITEMDYTNFETSIESLGAVRQKITLNPTTGYAPRNKAKVIYQPKFNTDIVTQLVYPGYDSAVLEHIIGRDPDGIILLGYGKGGVPSTGKHSLIPLIKAYSDSGKPLIVATQVVFGQCWMGINDASQKALEAGAICAYDMTYETTIVKFMWVLAQTQDRNEVAHMMQSNYAGEIEPPIMDGADDHFTA
jgi:L-asparaginase